MKSTNVRGMIFAIVAVMNTMLVISCHQDAAEPDGFAAVDAVSYVLLDNATLRLEPTHAEYVKHPLPGNGLIHNWVGELLRGQKITVHGFVDDWARITLDDGAEGWFNRSNLLPSEGLKQVTLLTETVSCGAPDYGACHQGQEQKIAAGSILFAFEREGLFTRVNVSGSVDAWVETASVTDNAQEVGVSNMITLARWSSQRNDLASNGRLLDKAREKYPHAKLLEELANEVPFDEYSMNPILPTSAPR